MNRIVVRFCALSIILGVQFPQFLFSQEALPLPLEAQGDIPEIFTTSSEAKYRLQMDRAAASGASQSDLATQKKFYFETNYGLDDLLRSGLISYNDEVSQYLGKIADILLKEEPQLRSELNFFAVFSPFPNAFATHRGSIFINLGLLSRLQTEAQVAFVLSHEIAHYRENHSLNKYVEYEDELWKRRSYRNATNQQRLAIRNNYSQKQEIEADELGYLLFARSPYGGESLADVFYILKRAEEPAGYATFYSDWLASTYFPASLLDSLIFESVTGSAKADQGQTGAVSYETGFDVKKMEAPARNEVQLDPGDLNRTGVRDDDEDENHSGTHPSPDRRRALIRELRSEQPEKGEESFVLSPSEFLKARRIARLESCKGYLHNGMYADALQAIHWLSSEGETDPYLEELKLRALYGIVFKKLEMASVKMEQDVPEDKAMLTSWLSDIRRKGDGPVASMGFSYLFESYASDTVAYSWLRPNLINLLEHFQSEISNGRNSEDELIPLIDHYQSVSGFAPLLSEAKTREKRREEWREFLDSDEGEDWYENWKKQGTQQGFSLGIDSILVFSPEYHRLRITRNKQKIFWTTSEQRQKLFSEEVPELASEIQMHIELLDPHQYQASTSATDYNDALQIQRWVDELLRYEEENFVPSNQKEVEEIFRRRGLRYIALPGAFSVNQPNYSAFAWLFLGTMVTIVSPPIWPYAIHTMTKRRESGFIYLLLLDVEHSSIYFKFLESPDFRVNAKTAAHYIQFMLSQTSQARD